MPIYEDPFEYLSFGSTFRRTFVIFYERYDVFLTLSSIVVIPYALLMLSIHKFLISFYIQQEEGSTESSTQNEFHPTHHIPMIVLVLTLQLAIYTIITIFGRAAIIKAVCILFYINDTPSEERLSSIVYDCLKSTHNKACQLLSANFIIYLSVLMGLFIPVILIYSAILVPNVISLILAFIALFILIFGGIYVYIGIVLTNPTIVIENNNFSSSSTSQKLSPIQPIQRSWELCTGSRCYIFCCLFILFLLNNIITRLLHTIFDSTDKTVMDILLSITGIITQILPMTFFFPLHAILETVIYLNLRIGRESMNHQILSGDLMMSGGGNTTTTTTTNNNNNTYLPVSIIGSSEPTIGGGGSNGNGGSSSSMMMRIGGSGISGSDYRNVPLMDTTTLDNNNNSIMEEESITFEHPTTTTTTSTVISEMV